MTKKSFFQGAAILAIAGIICKVLGAIYRIPLGNILGSEGMGNYQMAYPAFNLLAVISTSGLPTAVSKLVSAKTAMGNPSGAKAIFRCALILLSILGALSACALFLFSGPVARLIGMSSASIPIKALAPSLFLIAICAAIRGYFQGLQQMTPTACSQVTEQAVKLGGGIWIAGLMAPMGPEYGAAGALLGVTLSELAGLLVMVISYFRYGRTQAGRSLAPAPATSPLREILPMAVPITLGACVVPIVNLIDSSVVIRVLTSIGCSSSEASSLYGILTGFVSPLISMPGVLSVSIGISLVPAISAAAAKNRRESVVNQSALGLRMSVLLGLPFSVLFYALAEPMLSLLYSSLSAEEMSIAASLLRLMSPSILLLSMIQISTGILQGLSRSSLPVVSLVFGSAIKIFVGIWLIQVPAINIWGAAFSSVLCYALIAAIDVAMALKFSRARPPLGSFLLKPMLASAAAAGAALALQGCLSPMGQLSGGISMLAGLLVYAILLLLTGAIDDRDLAILPRGERLSPILSKMRIGGRKHDYRHRHR